MFEDAESSDDFIRWSEINEGEYEFMIGGKTALEVGIINDPEFPPDLKVKAISLAAKINKLQNKISVRPLVMFTNYPHLSRIIAHGRR